MSKDERAWFTAAARRKVTATEIADILGVARNTANKRLADGLSADDIITVARGLGLNPVEALVEMRFVSMSEAMDFVDSDGQLLATADEDRIFLELVDRKLTTPVLAQLLAMRTRNPHSAMIGIPPEGEGVTEHGDDPEPELVEPDASLGGQ